jgi:LemA protein
MLPILLAIVLVIIMVALWVMSIQRRLILLDENIYNSMSQIGVQLSSRFDVLMLILDLVKIYANKESEPLIKSVSSHRIVITAKSTPDDVIRQERIISEALDQISTISEQYPELKANKNYIKIMGAVQTFENMIATSRLIYNNSVTKLNREIRMFPVSMVAGMLGFSQRDYLND